MDCGGRPAEWSAQGCEVIGVAHEDIIVEPEGEQDEVAVDDIRRAGGGEEPTDRRAVVQGVQGDRLQEGR